jgi:hypothetical protein
VKNQREKQRAPAFQFYPRQFAGDEHVMAMDLDATGAHILLMCAAAASPERYRIDADERAIRNRLRNPSEEAWQRIKAQLLAGPWKLSNDGKWWVQDGLQRTFEKQKDFSESQRAKAAIRWHKENAEVMPDLCQTDTELMPHTMPQPIPKVCSSSSSSSSNPKTGNSSLNSTEVAHILCQQNGWTGRWMIISLEAAIEFQAKRMPESSLEQVGEWLVKAFFDHQTKGGKYGPQKFFEQAIYCPASQRPEAAANILIDNPATRALAQMEGD